MRGISLSILLLVLSGCATSPPVGTGAQSAPPAPDNNYSGRAYNKRYMVFGKTYDVLPSSLGYLEIGVASWYGRKFQGRLTSNGEVFDMYGVSAAHKSLPLPTMVRVTNLDNGRKVVVRVNDRGPFHDDRLIDLSYEAAVQLGFADKGVAPVVVEALDEMNYPDLVPEPIEHESFYLQVGAYSRLAGAEVMKAQILRVIGASEFRDINVRILESELDEQTILHKVWLGPIATQTRRDRLAALVEDNKLGVPLRVKVE